MADTTDLEEREICLYQKQILYLDKKLERCQLKCDNLEKKNKDLASRYRVLEEDRRGITEYLKYASLAKEKAADELAERLESQRQAIKKDTEALKLQHSQEIQELQERVGELSSASMEQAAKSEEQKELLKQQLSKMESLETQMEKIKAAFNNVNLETEPEKKKTPKELEDAIELKTSKIVREERALLSERSKQFHHLLFKNYNLMLRKDNLQRQLQNEMDKRAETQETEKERSQKQELMQGNYRTSNKHRLAEEEDLRRDQASVSEKCCEKTAKRCQLEADLQRESGNRRELERIMREAVTILTHIVKGSEEASNTCLKKERMKEVWEILKPALASQKTSSSVDLSHPAPQSDPSVPAPQSDLSPLAPQ